MDSHEIQSIRALAPGPRYEFLISHAAETQEVWLVENEEQKLLTMGDPEGNILIPVWPAKEFAELFLDEDWQEYHSVPIALEDFLEMLDQFEEDEVQVAGFPVPEGETVNISAGEVKAHLLEAGGQ